MSDGDKLLERIRSILDRGGFIALWADKPGSEYGCVVYLPKKGKDGGKVSQAAVPGVRAPAEEDDVNPKGKEV